MNSVVGPMLVMEGHQLPNGGHPGIQGQFGQPQMVPHGWPGPHGLPPGLALHPHAPHLAGPFGGPGPHGGLLLAHGGPPIPNGHQLPMNASMNRSQRCGVCRGCQCKPCGACTYCQDSPQFGGPGVKKQSCIERRCLRVLENRLQRDAPTFKARVGCNGCEDCRMPDCQICLVCLDKRFFENRYMTGAMCAKKRCNNATSIELPAAHAASHEFQQRQAQKRAYEATMEFHMKRRMEMASFLPGGAPHQGMQQIHIPTSLPLGQPLHPQQMIQIIPQHTIQIPPSLTPSSAATPPALEGEGGGTPSTPREDSLNTPPQTTQTQHQQVQQTGGLMIDPRILAQNNNINVVFAPHLSQPLLQTPPTSLAPPLQQPLFGGQQVQQQNDLFAPLYPSTQSPLQFDYIAKAYYMDDFTSAVSTAPNGDPFVPPSYAPEMKNAVVLQPL